MAASQTQQAKYVPTYVNTKYSDFDVNKMVFSMLEDKEFSPAQKLAQVTYKVSDSFNHLYKYNVRL